MVTATDPRVPRTIREAVVVDRFMALYKGAGYNIPFVPDFLEFWLIRRRAVRWTTFLFDTIQRAFDWARDQKLD